ncbi:hypothetical protein [Hanstruepera marina]|uniref:hypothetical protein n=1 Tax=Hanstruepera marina TaxID=2873265 RepID=UPI001CA60F2B|nr:hypothetical protein [Hanstruepera marina]
MSNKLTYIERQNSLPFRIAAALLYTVAIGLVIHFILTMDFSLKKRHFYAHFDYLQLIFLCLFLAIYFSYTINCHFDFEKKRFKREYTVGVFKYGKWKPMPKFDYVSLYAVNASTFQVNLWNNKNKHWDLYEEFNLKDAFRIAFELSEELKLPLLDSTIPNNFQWVDKVATKDSGKIVYKD